MARISYRPGPYPSARYDQLSSSCHIQCPAQRSTTFLVMFVSQPWLFSSYKMCPSPLFSCCACCDEDAWLSIQLGIWSLQHATTHPHQQPSGWWASLARPWNEVSGATKSLSRCLLSNQTHTKVWQQHGVHRHGGLGQPADSGHSPMG